MEAHVRSSYLGRMTPKHGTGLWYMEITMQVTFVYPLPIYHIPTTGYISILGICQYILSRSNLFSSIQVHEHLIGGFEFKRNPIEMNDYEYDKYKTLYIKHIHIHLI